MLPLSTKSQPDPARHEDLKARTLGKEVGYDRCRRGHLLKVIEDEELLPLAQQAAHRLEQRHPRLLTRTESQPDRWQDKIWITQGGQIYEGYPIGEVDEDIVSDCQRETRLA